MSKHAGSSPQPVKLHQAKEYFRLGVLRSYWLERAIVGGGWLILLRSSEGSDLYLATARGDIREFKSLDTAVGVLEDIGFKIDIIQPGGAGQ